MDPTDFGLECKVEGKNVTDIEFCHNICHPSNCTCSSFYVQSSRGGCKYYDHNGSHVIHKKDMVLDEMNSFQCFSRNAVPKLFVNGLIPDCMNQEDENELITITQIPSLMQTSNCPTDTMFACFPGHSHCYHFHKQCLYELHPTHNTLLHCRNGEHLNSCSDIECTAALKCPGYYCIPWGYVCDDKWAVQLVLISIIVKKGIVLICLDVNGLKYVSIQEMCVMEFLIAH